MKKQELECEYQKYIGRDKNGYFYCNICVVTYERSIRLADKVRSQTVEEIEDEIKKDKTNLNGFDIHDVAQSVYMLNQRVTPVRPRHLRYDYANQYHVLQHIHDKHGKIIAKYGVEMVTYT